MHTYLKDFLFSSFCVNDHKLVQPAGGPTAACCESTCDRLSRLWVDHCHVASTLPYVIRARSSDRFYFLVTLFNWGAAHMWAGLVAMISVWVAVNSAKSGNESLPFSREPMSWTDLRFITAGRQKMSIFMYCICEKIWSAGKLLVITLMLDCSEMFAISLKKKKFCLLSVI